MKITRRTMLLGTGGSCAWGFDPHQGSMPRTLPISWQNNLPVTHPLNIRLKEAADKILEGRAGRLRSTSSRAASSATTPKRFRSFVNGANRVLLALAADPLDLVPNAAISGIGFAFPDYDTVWKAMDGELAPMRAANREEGLVPMEKIWDRRLSPDHQFDQADQHPGDLKGFQDPRSAEPALAIHVHRLRRCTDHDQFRGSLHGRSAPAPWTARKTAGNRLDRQASTRCRNIAP